MSRVRPILRWPGGKSRLLAEILPLLPARDQHVCYCEPFAGGLAVLLAKEPSKKEVVNDLNGDIIFLYRSVQYHLPELQREISFLLNSRKNLFDFLAQPGLTEIQRAARFLMRNKTSFGGNMKSFAVGKTEGGGASVSRLNMGVAMEALNRRLDKVTFENLDYERCVKNYDSKEAFFFFDPPYLNAKIDAYRGWTEAEMRNFRKVVERVKGGWVLTVDGSQFNRELFSDCKIREVSTRNGCVNNRTAGAMRFPEFIITPA